MFPKVPHKFLIFRWLQNCQGSGVGSIPIGRSIKSSTYRFCFLSVGLVQFGSPRGLQGSHIGGNNVYFYNVSAGEHGGAVAYDSFRASLMPADLHFSEQFL